MDDAKINKILSSAINKKIVGFFYEHPGAVDTPEAIALWLNQKEEKVKLALDLLAKHNILNLHKIGSTAAYAYTQDKQIIKQIEQALAPAGKGGKNVQPGK